MSDIRDRSGASDRAVDQVSGSAQERFSQADANYPDVSQSSHGVGQTAGERMDEAQKRKRGRPAKPRPERLPNQVHKTRNLTRPRGLRRVAKLSQSEVAAVVGDYVAGLPQVDIAKKHLLSNAAVSLLLGKYKHIFQDLDKVEDYRKAKVDFIDACAFTSLKSAMTEEKLRDATYQSLMYGFDKLNQHSRLEQGKSTSNSAVQHIEVSVDSSRFTRER